MSKKDRPTTATRAPRTLKEYSLRRGSLSQPALAKAAGVTQSYISHLIKGDRAARIDIAERISAITGVPDKSLQRIRVPRAPEPEPEPVPGRLQRLLDAALADYDNDNEGTDHDDDNERSAGPVAHR